MSKEYKLLKDLPEAKAGSIVSKYGSSYRVFAEWEGENPLLNNYHFFSTRLIEDNPDWFKEIKLCKTEKELSHAELLNEIIKSLEKLKAGIGKSE